MAYTDNFNRSNGGLGSNWTEQNSSSWSVEGNGVVCNSAVECAARYSAGTFANDQYAQLKLTTYNPSWMYLGVTVRASGTNNWYGAYVGGSGSTYELMLFKMVAGTWTQLGSTYSGSWAANDVIRVEANGTTIRALQNGTSRISVTDSALTSGQAGLTGYGPIDPSLLKGDDWEGGDLSTGGTTYNDSLSVGRTTGWTVANAATFADNVSVARTEGITDGSAATFASAVSFGRTIRVLEWEGEARFPVSVTYTRTEGVTPAAAQTFADALSLPRTPGASFIGGMTFADAVTLATTLTMAQGAAVSKEEALTVARTAGYLAAPYASYADNLTLARTIAALTSSTGTFTAAVTLDGIRAFTVVGGMTFADALTLARSLAYATVSTTGVIVYVDDLRLIVRVSTTGEFVVSVSTQAAAQADVSTQNTVLLRLSTSADLTGNVSTSYAGEVEL